MVRAVSTRWNALAEMIGRANELRAALTLLVNMEQHNKSCGVRLKRFQLSTQEWELLLQLHPLLDVCFHQLYIDICSFLNRLSLRQRRKCRKARLHLFMKSFRSSTLSPIILTHRSTIQTTSQPYVQLHNEGVH